MAEYAQYLLQRLPIIIIIIIIMNSTYWKWIIAMIMYIDHRPYIAYSSVVIVAKQCWFDFNGSIMHLRLSNRHHAHIYQFSYQSEIQIFVIQKTKIRKYLNNIIRYAY